jgi:hypothetical protein
MGILVNNGSITMSGAFLAIGIPLLAIGKYHCNQNSNDCSFVPVPFITMSWTSMPFQWILGYFLVLMAAVAIFLELTAYGKNHRNKNKGDKNTKSKNSYVFEAELVATHFRHDEIAAKIEENIIFYSQSVANNDTYHEEIICDDYLEKSNLLGNGLHDNPRNNKSNKEKDCSLEQEHSTAAEKVMVYLNALTIQVSSKQEKMSAALDEISDLYLSCQDVSYRTLLSFHHNDKVVSSALSLLAITAKHPAVCQRIVQMKDRYGLYIPIQAMEISLKRSKSVSNPRKEDEFLAAELQRKACLFLGALADGDSQDLCISKKIIENNGLDAILNAIDWFRYHDEVVNWGLWAIFMICFENDENKQVFVHLGGIQKVCQALRTILKDYSEIRKDRVGSDYRNTKSSTVEVTRHGVAILFDILRHQDECSRNSRPDFIDLEQLRRIALNAGLHYIVADAMKCFQENTEIMMMGQQMLIATGYAGDLLEFAGPS